jgi:hypothetical protein
MTGNVQNDKRMTTAPGAINYRQRIASLQEAMKKYPTSNSSQNSTKDTTTTSV